jgi:DNA-binding NarL/FixJ family response regulator
MLIKVAILEDHAPWRRTLETLLSGTPGFRCVCACGTAEELLRQIAAAKPDVVLVDLELPGASGADCIRRLKAESPNLGLLVITNFADTDHIFRAIRAGACGYVLKRTPPAKILEAIEEVHSGGAPMTPQIARLVLESLHDPTPPGPPDEKLTDREVEVLQLAQKGLRYRQIADALGISHDTVRAHFRNIYRKLHVRSRFEAVARYLKPW